MVNDSIKNMEFLIIKAACALEDCKTCLKKIQDDANANNDIRENIADDSFNTEYWVAIVNNIYKYASIQKIADLLGVSYSTVRLIKSGIRRPSKECQDKLLELDKVYASISKKEAKIKTTPLNTPTYRSNFIYNHGKALRLARISSGLKTSYVCERLHINCDRLRRIETNVHGCKVTLYKQLCDLYKMNCG
jgi:transcriptional regulator with XRE-family HTH domain